MAAVAAVARHRPAFSDRILRSAAAAGEGGGVDALTAREREIVQLLAEGRGNREIAEALAISARTVESYRAAIMRKLDLGSLADLVRYAIREQLVEP